MRNYKSHASVVHKSGQATCISWPQLPYVSSHFVCSAANCQLSCTLSVQMSLSYQLNMLLEMSALLICNVSARLHSVSSTVFLQFDSDLLFRLQCVRLALRCQLRCNLSAQLPLVHCLVGSVQFVSWTVSSAKCSSDAICSLSSFCHLCSISSSQLQFAHCML